MKKENPKWRSIASIYSLLKRDKAKLKEIYQLLCANCNWIKRVENGESSLGRRKYEDEKEGVSYVDKINTLHQIN